MQFLSSIDVSWLLSGFDYWAARYQGAFVGLVALTIAFQQLGIANRQARISQEQYKMSADQRATDVALATITVDRFLVPVFTVLGSIIANCFHHDTGQKHSEGFVIWHWKATALREFADLLIPDDFEEAAAKAFPTDAPNLVQLSLAVADAKKLLPDLKGDGWDVYGPDPVKTDDALNRFFMFANKCSALQPHARK